MSSSSRPPPEPPVSSRSSKASAPATKAGPAPVLWVLVGVCVTLAVVVTLRLVDRTEPATASHSSASSPAAAALVKMADTPQPPGSARAHFAELYVNYLLRTYYVRRRGFCKKLLAKICTALLNADLLAAKSTCRGLPNDAFVLGIGRYQHRVGLPVDGKAGPETVRMMLGGDFSNREGMAATYCGVALPRPDGGADMFGER